MDATAAYYTYRYIKHFCGDFKILSGQVLVPPPMYVGLFSGAIVTDAAECQIQDGRNTPQDIAKMSAAAHTDFRLALRVGPDHTAKAVRAKSTRLNRRNGSSRVLCWSFLSKKAAIHPRSRADRPRADGRSRRSRMGRCLPGDPGRSVRPRGPRYHSAETAHAAGK